MLETTTRTWVAPGGTRATIWQRVSAGWSCSAGRSGAVVFVPAITGCLPRENAKTAAAIRTAPAVAAASRLRIPTRVVDASRGC